mmetsp:Transcript_9394/g.20342  ORF Transcript_9394/g.20342 Transcript_9394/m.20342 type:complete len:91 (-) Transcript_9394:758-1030(-)
MKMDSRRRGKRNGHGNGSVLSARKKYSINWHEMPDHTTAEDIGNYISFLMMMPPNVMHGKRSPHSQNIDDLGDISRYIYAPLPQFSLPMP